MIDTTRRCRRYFVATVFALTTTPVPAQLTGDYIAAVVNREAVTAGEVQRRIERAREAASRSSIKLPSAGELRKQALDEVIDERVQLSHARDSGQKIDAAELDRAVASIAAQNQLTVSKLREQLSREGISYERFRTNVSERMLVERVREREVQSRIKVTEREIDDLLGEQRASANALVEYNIAQLVVPVSESATETEILERRQRAEQALAHARAGKNLAAAARELANAGGQPRVSETGLRSVDRLPDPFVEFTRTLMVGDVAPSVLRTGAGFHVIKLIDRRQGVPFELTLTKARHILLRPNAGQSPEAALRKLSEFKIQIEAGTRQFEQLARKNSDDASASSGGDLGWVTPGTVVAEFEQTMNALEVGAIAEPFVSRFGAHLLQVLERRKTTLEPQQQREQVRGLLHEQKFAQAYAEWASELRARAYIELRDPPPR